MTKVDENKIKMNRETWLNELKDRMELHFNEAGLTFRKKIQVSTGFCKGSKARGQCFYHGDDDDICSIIIEQKEVDSLAVAEILCHELIHASLPKGTGHKKPFLDACDKVGIVRSKYTGITPVFVAWVQEYLDELGEYPQVPIPIPEKKKGNAKFQRAKCPQCDIYTYCETKFLDIEEYKRFQCPCCLVPLLTKDEDISDVPRDNDGDES